MSGADVVSVSSQPSGVVKASVDGYTVTKDAKITFTLTNLHAGAVVTIAAEGKGPQSAGKAPPLKFTVIDG